MANITLTPEVRDILTRSTITANSLVLPPGQLDRPLYEAVNKALVLAGGKWNRSAKAHLFNGDPREKLGLILETGVAIDEKKLYQTFFTPPELAQRVAEMADVEGYNVLEPSAGEGALADACEAQGGKVSCVELKPENAAKLRGKGYPVIEGDFLKVSPPATSDKYLRIVMNPPFTKNQDIKHVAHALQFLAPEGILTAIMSANIGRAPLKKLLEGRTYTTEDVPAGTFKDSGTMVATVILQVYED